MKSHLNNVKSFQADVFDYDQFGRFSFQRLGDSCKAHWFAWKNRKQGTLFDTRVFFEEIK